MQDCIFCKIVRGEMGHEKIYEDDKVYAFLDAFSQAEGHTLIIPKKHFKNTIDIDENTLTHIIKIAKMIGTHYVEHHGFNGFHIVNNNEPAANQSVFHTHYHVIPRKTDDGFKLFYENYSGKQDLKAVAKRLKIN